MANRIDYKTAKLPAPTPALLMRMAGAGYKYNVEIAAIDPKRELKDQGSDVQDIWVGVARAMYAEVAVAGGAVQYQVEQPEKG